MAGLRTEAAGSARFVLDELVLIPRWQAMTIVKILRLHRWVARRLYKSLFQRGKCAPDRDLGSVYHVAMTDPHRHWTSIGEPGPWNWDTVARV